MSCTLHWFTCFLEGLNYFILRFPSRVFLGLVVKVYYPPINFTLAIWHIWNIPIVWNHWYFLSLDSQLGSFQMALGSVCNSRIRYLVGHNPPPPLHTSDPFNLGRWLNIEALLGVPLGFFYIGWSVPILRVSDLLGRFWSFRSISDISLYQWRLLGSSVKPSWIIYCSDHTNLWDCNVILVYLLAID